MKRFILALIVSFFASSVIAQEIVEAEYFFDTDPGVGNGIPLSVTPSDTIDQTFDINLNGLDAGGHLLVVRVKDNNGHWSLSKQARFYVEGHYEAPQPLKIVGAEYFIDEDPGVGNATYATVNSASQDVLIDVDYTLNNLAIGKHQLCIRVKDEEGNWSIGKSYFFYLESNYSPSTPDTASIVYVEYFINKPDPEYGNATSIGVNNPSQDIFVSDSLDLRTTDLAIGRHQFLVRIKNSRDQWSLLNVQPFDYCSPEGVIGGFEHTLVDNVLTINDTSRNAVLYIWDMGDGSDPIRDTLTSYTYVSGGVYEVCQIAYSNCDADTTCKTINVNTPMLGDTLKNMTIEEDAGRVVVSEDLNLNFIDPDGETFTFKDTLLGSKSLIEVSIEENKRLVINTLEHKFGRAWVSLDAEAGGVSITHRFLVIVNPVNDDPYLAEEIRDVVYDEDSGPRLVTNRLENFIKDYDDTRYFDSLAWRWRYNRLEFAAESDIPELVPVIFNNDSLMIELAEDFNGEGYITLTATDDSLASLEEIIKVTVLPIMDAPKLISPVGSLVFQEDPGNIEIVSNLNEMFYEPDGESMTFTSTSDNTDIQLEISGNKASLNVSDNYHGTANATISASDGTFVTVDSFKIEVLPVNDAPTFSGLENLGICPEIPLQINLLEKVSDVESDVENLNISATILSSSSAAVKIDELSLEINETGMLTLNSNAIPPTQFQIIFTASDPQGTIGRDTISIAKYGAEFIQVEDTLIANEGGASYQWYVDGTLVAGATQRKLLARKLGNYQVETTSNGCNVMSSSKILVGLEEEMLKTNTILYPNPTSDIFSLQYTSNYKGEVSVQVYDALGKSVFSDSYLKKEASFREEIVHLEKVGVYLVEIKTARARIVKRVVVK